MRRAAGALAALWLAAASAVTAAQAAEQRPNIIVILADDVGYGDLGCYGATMIKTPNIDRLAANGRRFLDVYAPSSTCTPSRYSLMTGQYHWRVTERKTGILAGNAPLCIGLDQMTVPKMLQGAGYKTALIGKWHLGLGTTTETLDFNAEIKPGPLEVGFDYAFFIAATLDRVPTVLIENHRIPGLETSDPIHIDYKHKVGNDPTGAEKPETLRYPADPEHSGTIVNRISRIGFMEGGHSARWTDENIADQLVAKAEGFIEANKADPFYLYLAMPEPHVPRAPNERFLGRSGTGIRGDSIVELDAAVGHVLETLDRLKLADKTLVIFSSDNGPIVLDGYQDGSDKALGDHKPAGPLRGWKYSIWEGGTRVPFIARWPGHVKVGQANEILALPDLLATFAALTGQKLPPGAGPDSVNVLPNLLGETDAPIRTDVVTDSLHGKLALRQGDWKFVPAGGGTGYRNDGKVALNAHDNTIDEDLLFHLSDDAAEKQNLAVKMPEKVTEMKAALDKIKAGSSDPGPPAHPND